MPATAEGSIPLPSARLRCYMCGHYFCKKSKYCIHEFELTPFFITINCHICDSVAVQYVESKVALLIATSNLQTQQKYKCIGPYRKMKQCDLEALRKRKRWLKWPGI